MILVVELLPLTAYADSLSGGSTQGVCQGSVPAATRCQWIAGTVAIYNGTPAIRIRPDQGGAMLAVGPSEDEAMPDELKVALKPDHPLHARMLICPLRQSEPRGLRRVCVGVVENLSVVK